MPYIKQEHRLDYDDNLKLIAETIRKHSQTDSGLRAGHLNYCMTKLVLEVLGQDKIRYSDINEMMGVFACASAELYRRLAVPYENSKIASDGDVY